MSCKVAIYSSPIGFIRIKYSENRLTMLHILDSEPKESKNEHTIFSDMVFSQILEYIRGERAKFDIEIDISNSTPFQQKVLNELCRIPYGQTRSYKDIAIAIGSPKAARAVGMANNRNPIHIIIPCHRVIGSRGELTGYAAGLDTKEFLLNLEREIFKT